jgi:uncharacterized protein GlcG (DUF336 family)
LEAYEVIDKSELISRGHSKLTLSGAKLMVEAAERKAEQMGLAMDIAICDEGGNLLAFHRMDGAKITSIEVAIGKAFTAAASRLSTARYGEVAGPGKPAFGIHASNPGKFMIFGGGLPFQVGAEHLGGIGCSSGSVDEDTEVAQAGIDALKEAMGEK